MTHPDNFAADTIREITARVAWLDELDADRLEGISQELAGAIRAARGNPLTASVLVTLREVVWSKIRALETD